MLPFFRLRQTMFPFALITSRTCRGFMSANFATSVMVAWSLNFRTARIASRTGWVADLAWARNAPDWGQGDRLALVPCGWDWDEEQECFVAGTAPTGSLWVWRDHRRHRRKMQGQVCAVSYTGTTAMITAKRRNYLTWCGVLLDLWAVLSHPGMLDTIEISGAMPVLAPWREGARNAG